MPNMLRTNKANDMVWMLIEVCLVNIAKTLKVKPLTIYMMVTMSQGLRKGLDAVGATAHISLFMIYP